MSTRDGFQRSFAAYADGSPTVGVGLWLAGILVGAAAVAAFLLADRGTVIGPLDAGELRTLAVLAGGLAIPLALLGTVTALNDGAIALVAVVGAVVPMLVSGVYVNVGTLAWAPTREVLLAGYAGGVVLLVLAILLAAASARDPTARRMASSSGGTETGTNSGAGHPGRAAATGGPSGPGTGTGDTSAVRVGDGSGGDTGTDDAVAAADGDADAEADGDADAEAESGSDVQEETESGIQGETETTAPMDDPSVWFGDEDGRTGTGSSEATADQSEPAGNRDGTESGAGREGDDRTDATGADPDSPADVVSEELGRGRSGDDGDGDDEETEPGAETGAEDDDGDGDDDGEEDDPGVDDEFNWGGRGN